MPRTHVDVTHQEIQALPAVASSRFGFLGRPTWLEAKAMEKLLELEAHVHCHIRRETFPRLLFGLVLCLASALVGCEALFLARTWSLDEAGDVCTGEFDLVLSNLDEYERAVLMGPVNAILPRKLREN